MSTVSRARKPAKPRTFACRIECDGIEYSLYPLDPHPALATVAYRFFKRSDDFAMHDVRRTPEGHVECDCPGFVYHGKCKHVAMLAALGCLNVPDGAPELIRGVVPEAAPGRSTFRSAGDMARNDPAAYAEEQEALADMPVTCPPTDAELDAMAEHFGAE